MLWSEPSIHPNGGAFSAVPSWGALYVETADSLLQVEPELLFLVEGTGQKYQPGTSYGKLLVHAYFLTRLVHLILHEECFNQILKQRLMVLPPNSSYMQSHKYRCLREINWGEREFPAGMGFGISPTIFNGQDGLHNAEEGLRMIVNNPRVMAATIISPHVYGKEITGNTPEVLCLSYTNLAEGLQALIWISTVVCKDMASWCWEDIFWKIGGQ